MSAPWPYSGSSAPFPAAGTSQVSLPDETADGSKKRKRQSDSQDNPYYQMGNPEAGQGKGKQRAIDQDSLESTQANQQLASLATASYTNDNNVEANVDEDEELEEGEISEDEAGEAEAIADLIVAPRLKPTPKTQVTVASPVPPPAQLPQVSQYAQIHPIPSQTKNPLGNPPISSQGQPSPSIARSHTALQSQQAVASSKLANKPIHPPFNLQSGMTQDVMNDCITLIEQLYSWGMTVDYMLGQGLEKDLVLHVFVERGFKLPPHHLQYYQEKLSGQALGKSAIPSGPRRQTKVSPSYPRPDQTGSFAPPRGPSAYQVPTAPSQPRPLRPTAAPQHGTMPAPIGVDLSEKEAKARNALLARKAKIAKKNAEKAQDFMAMEAQLSDLLAGIANDNAMITVEENRDSSGDDMQIDSDDSAEASVIEAKAEGAAASTTPVEPVVAAKQVSPEAPAAQLSSKQSVSNSRRPVASDFEAEPVQSLPNVPRWSAHLAPSTRFHDLVISLSDDESEDDSDTEQLRSMLKETKKQETNGKSPAYPAQTALPPVSRKPSPILAAPPPLSAKQAAASPVIAKAEAPQLDAKAQLEAKQAEIKRMMEVISKLEQKKKTTGSKTASRSGTPSSIPASTPTAASDKPNPLEAHMKASSEKKHLRQAIETVEQLLEEKQELIEQVEESQQAIAEDMQVEQIAAVEDVQEAVVSVEDAQMETEPQEPPRADSLEPYDDGHESSDDDAMLIITTSNMQTDAAMTKEDLMSDPEGQDNKAQGLDLLEQTQIKHGTST